MPTRSASPRSLLVPVAAALALACIAPSARAQVNYTEGADLSNNPNFPTPVGTVAVGLNTVTGSISATWGASGPPQIDSDDVPSFIVPPGLAVASIQIVVTNFACTSCSDELEWVSGGSGLVDLTGNGTFTLPISGPLTAGTYTVDVDVLRHSQGIAGSSSYSYQLRINVIPANNDSCQFATTIGPGSYLFSNSSATTDGPPTIGCGQSIDISGLGHDLWYLYVPSLAGLITANTCGSGFDTAIAVYTGACGSLTQVACNDDNAAACGGNGFQSQLSFTAAAGTPYLIRVGGFASSVGTGVLALGAVTTGACCNRWTGNCTVRGQFDCTSQGLRFDGFGATCSTATCKACPAEFNGNGTLEVVDIFAFLNSWFAGCP